MLPCPPPCPPWCLVTHTQADQGWDVTPTAVTRTCERRIVVETAGEHHEIALQRFAAIEFGALRCDPPIVRFDDSTAVPLAFALNMADSLRRLVDLAGEPSLAA